MKPKFVITTDFNEESSKPLADAAKASGFNVLEVTHGDLSPKCDKFSINSDYGRNQCIIGYGSIQFIHFVQKNMCWYPGEWCDWEKFKCTTYLNYWGKYSIQQNYAYLSLGELRIHKERIFEQYGRDGNLFVRPDGNNKSINGHVANIKTFDKWWFEFDCDRNEINSLVMVSQPSKLKDEWRIIVSDKKVLTGSMYRKNGEAKYEDGCPREVKQFVCEVADSRKFSPAPIFCMDICSTESGDLRLLEIGSINCAGLYDSDLSLLVNEMARIGLRDFNEAIS